MSETNVRNRKPQTSLGSRTPNVSIDQKTTEESNRWKIKVALTTVLFALLCVYGYYSSPINAVEITGVVEVPFEGLFALNRKLSKGKRITGLLGPESVVEGSGEKLYTGLADGRIVCIHPSSDGEIGAGKVENITTGIIQGAVTTSNAWGHGRPLGLRLRQNLLYVMDAIYGFYVIDLSTKSIKILVKPDDVSPPVKFPDDFDITADGKTVYISDASTQHAMPQMIEFALEGSCTGRIIKYDMVSHILEVVRDGLCFPNGVQLTDDETIVIVPETHRYKINWIDTKTWKTRNVLHLPVMPDNVRRSTKGTFWVAGAFKLTPALKFLFMFPTVRQIAAGLISPHTLSSAGDFAHCVVIEVNDAGEVMQTLQDPHGEVPHGLTEAHELSDGRMVLGSVFTPFLAIADRSWSNEE